MAAAPNPLKTGDRIVEVHRGGVWETVDWKITENMPMGHGMFGPPAMLIGPTPIRVARLNKANTEIDTPRAAAAGPKDYEDPEEIIVQMRPFRHEGLRRVQAGNDPQTQGRINYLAKADNLGGPRFYRATFEQNKEKRGGR